MMSAPEPPSFRAPSGWPPFATRTQGGHCPASLWRTKRTCVRKGAFRSAKRKASSLRKRTGSRFSRPARSGTPGLASCSSSSPTRTTPSTTKPSSASVMPSEHRGVVCQHCKSASQQISLGFILSSSTSRNSRMKLSFCDRWEASTLWLLLLVLLRGRAVVLITVVLGTTARRASTVIKLLLIVLCGSRVVVVVLLHLDPLHVSVDLLRKVPVRERLIDQDGHVRLREELHGANRLVVHAAPEHLL
mmetsp:Transcript_1772/g.5543  ORF Transcript_1772/g.5543 Transcript_1772/m.5543 type:complete len:246 (-) Transcript_1772:223-960(-)